jgi:hypothetical protein
MLKWLKTGARSVHLAANSTSVFRSGGKSWIQWSMGCTLSFCAKRSTLWMVPTSDDSSDSRHHLLVQEEHDGRMFEPLRIDGSRKELHGFFHPRLLISIKMLPLKTSARATNHRRFLSQGLVVLRQGNHPNQHVDIAKDRQPLFAFAALAACKPVNRESMPASKDIPTSVILNKRSLILKKC